MVLCKVIGSVVSTQKNKALTNYKLLIVQPVDLEGRLFGKEVLALDSVDAGIGDTVLIIQEGQAAQQILQRKDAPVHSIVVAVIDGMSMS